MSRGQKRKVRRPSVDTAFSVLSNYLLGITQRMPKTGQLLREQIDPCQHVVYRPVACVGSFPIVRREKYKRQERRCIKKIVEWSVVAEL
jgi:hypothetical protein